MSHRLKTSEALLSEILERLIHLDFAHLCILGVNLAEHQFNILQAAEINRLRSSKDDQPLPDGKDTIQ